jgi:hypothetical protein
MDQRWRISGARRANKDGRKIQRKWRKIAVLTIMSGACLAAAPPRRAGAMVEPGWVEQRRG